MVRDKHLFDRLTATELASHEIEGLRRSLAMSNNLPSDRVRLLLDTCDGLFARYNALEARDERLRAELDALRPVVAELRQRLTTLTRDLGDH